MVSPSDGAERVASSDAVGHLSLAVSSLLLVHVRCAVLYLRLALMVTGEVFLLIRGKVDRSLSRQDDHLRLLVAGMIPFLYIGLSSSMVSRETLVISASSRVVQRRARWTVSVAIGMWIADGRMSCSR